MDDQVQGTLSDEDIRTILPVGGVGTKLETDPDNDDADGTDGDSSGGDSSDADGTDAEDGSDADGTDGKDADGTDGDQFRHLVTSRIPEPVRATLGRSTDPLHRCVGDREAFLRDTWGVRVDVHTPAEPRGFQDLLMLDDVDRILTTTSLSAPRRSGW